MEQAGEHTADEPGHDHPGIHDIAAVFHQLHGRRIVHAQFEETEGLHGKGAARPGQGRQQVQGLHALDDMVVTCAHALAARAVIPDPFAEHYDILPHAPCGACSATPFPGAAALLTLPSGACFFKPRGMAARDAGIPHAPEPSVRVPCSRSQKAPSLPAGPSGNDRAVWQAPEKKPPCASIRHRAASTARTAPGKPVGPRPVRLRYNSSKARQRGSSGCNSR